MSLLCEDFVCEDGVRLDSGRLDSDLECCRGDELGCGDCRRMGEGEEVGALLIIREAGTAQAARASEATHMEALDAPWELDQVLPRASSLLCGTMSKTLQVLCMEQCSRMEAG